MTVKTEANKAAESVWTIDVFIATPPYSCSALREMVLTVVRVREDLNLIRVTNLTDT
jgi:hypothetical protein